MRHFVSNVMKEPKRLIASILTVFLVSEGLLVFVMYEVNHELNNLYPADAESLRNKVWVLESLILFALVGVSLFLYLLYHTFSNRTQLPAPSFKGKAMEKKEMPLDQVVTAVTYMLEEQKRIEEELRFREEWLRTTLNSMAHAVLTSDDKGFISYMNPMAEKMTGWKIHEAEGKLISDVYRARIDGNKAEVINPLQQVKGSASEKIAQYVLRSKNGNELWILSSIAPMRTGQGEMLGIVIAFQDNTEQKQQEKQMNYEAHYDDLTGLPNRRYLQKAFQALKSQNRDLAVLFLDLDRFKSVNDSFGHEVGDKLLKSVAERLQAMVSKRDVISRLAGDEFIIILHNITKPQAVGVAQRIVDAMKEPFYLKGIHLMITPSIGISFCPGNGTQFDELLDRADQAMYAAKKKGKNGYQLYEDTIKIG
ncbi:diguanylate cyclase [Ammoniphilus sp. 3BR4]|uniref:diguanylate cyclase domain-containing protein n=1 Tax=Ammoniphilus sp. 3BR4 TaxID=3158265 RepID=UPI0034679E83